MEVINLNIEFICAKLIWIAVPLNSNWMFYCRYLPYGRRTTEDNIQWERLRAPPVDTPPNVLHVSDCLDDLKPGDHIEIQWRKAREFPYGMFLNQHASVRSLPLI